MHYVRLGTCGPTVSRVALGMMSFGNASWRPWILDEAGAETVVRRAVEVGITFFDTSDHYSDGASEEITGRLLRRFFARRDDYILSSRVSSRVLSREHIHNAIDASLRRLGIDHVDLYLIHRWDRTTPIEETIAALGDVVRAGKARHIGASSMYAWQFAKAQHEAERQGGPRFISMQNHYNLVYREEEREMIPLCRDLDVGITPWSPLARGLLTRDRTRDGERRSLRGRTDDFARQLYDESDRDVVDRLIDTASQRGQRPAQLALAWLLHKPGVTAPIVGATQPAHIQDAVTAVDLTLSADEIRHLEEPYRPHPIRGHQ